MNEMNPKVSQLAGLKNSPAADKGRPDPQNMFYCKKLIIFYSLPFYSVKLGTSFSIGLTSSALLIVVIVFDSF